MTDRMKAVTYRQYGPPEVMKLVDVERPVPRDTEVLVKVAATTMNRTDCGARSAAYVVSRIGTGLFRPKPTLRSGSEFAGTVVEVGSQVDAFAVGDRVFGFHDSRFGTHAEYTVQPAAGPIARIPDGISFHDIAPAGEGATYALSILRARGVAAGDDVMVYGATGAIGSAAVQLAKHLGATVTAVCGTTHLHLMAELGADRVVDYQSKDFTMTDRRYDLVLDAVGKSSFGACKKLLTPDGTYYSTELGAGGQNVTLALWFWMTRRRSVMFPIPSVSQGDMEFFAELVARGEFRPLIDRSYPLDEIVEAARFVETAQKVGNVVITVADTE